MKFDSRRTRIIAFYIFAFASGGVIKPFLNLYLVEVGFSGTQVGVLLGYTSLFIVLVTPLIGWIADRTQRHRLILGILSVIKGFSAPAMLLSSAWGWLATTASLRVMTAGAQDALMNRLTMARLNEEGQVNLGGIRVWGALSFAATSILTGFLARNHSVSVLFPLSGILGICAAICVTGFPAQISPRFNIRLDRSTFHRSSKTLFFFALIFLLSLTQSGYETFANIHMKTNLDADNVWVGFTSATDSLTLVFALAYAGRLLRRFGKLTTLKFSIVLSTLAYIVLALAPSLLWTLPSVIIYSTSRAFYFVSMVIFIAEFGHLDQAATDQMLAQVTLPGLAGLLALPLSGWVFDVLGGRSVFIFEAIIAVLTLALLAIFSRKFYKEDEK